MFKKLVSLILCILLAAGVLAGCTVIVDRAEEDLAQTVAEIKPYWVNLQVPKSVDMFSAQEISLIEAYNVSANTNNEYAINLANSPNFTSDDLAAFVKCGVNPYKDASYMTDHKKITKYALLQQANSNVEEIVSNQGGTVEYLFSVSLDQLINKELILLEIERLDKLGLVRKPTLTQENQIWKDAYDAIDTEIYNIMTEIADREGEAAPAKPQAGVDAQPTYTIKTVEAKEEDIDKDTIEWVPEASRYPKLKAGQLILSSEDQLFLEGLRGYLEKVIDALEKNKYLLSDKQLVEFNNDKEWFNSFKDAKPAGLLGIYETLKTRFCIKYFYFDSAYDSYRITNLQKMVTGDIVITDAKVREKYDSLLATQKVTYKDEAAYKTAIDDTANLLIYRPYNVQQYYVKHILLPFSEAQKAMFAADNTKTDDQLKTIRNELINSITSYAHVNGFDYVAGGLKSYQQIVGEIESKMAGLAGHSVEAEAMFEELIFKYNTDPGIFNNAVGYGLRYGEKSSFMPEFEEAAIRLYEKYLDIGNKAIGTLDYATTDYGVHVMMLSSVLPTGTAELSSFTNVMRTETVYENIYKSLKTTEETNAFNLYQSSLINKLTAERKNEILKYEKRYESFLKS